MTRMIVAGSRDFQDYALMCSHLDKITAGIPGRIELISGHAPGADSLGERYAREHKMKVRVFPARWVLYGKAAGVIRNQEMVDFARKKEAIAVFFWNGTSRGTRDAIWRSLKAGIRTKIIRFDEKGGLQK